MQKRIASIGVIVVGAVMIISVFTADLFTVAPAFEDLTDGFRDTVMTQESVDQARADLAGLEAVSVEFETVVAPTLAGALEMDAATFAGFMQSEFPAVAAGADALPAITAQFSDVMNLIESEIDNFNKADEIPTDSLPATTVPWAIAILGVIAIVIGGFMLVGSRSAAITALVVGLLAVGGTVVFSLVDKSNAADDMNEAFKPAYTEELVTQSQAALVVMGAMGTEMQTVMVPALAEQQGMTIEQMQGFMADTFPATSAVLQEMPAAMERFTGMVTAFDEQLGNYDTIKNTALTPVAWTITIGGLVMALFGLWVLVARKSDGEQPAKPARKPDMSGAAT